MTHLKEKTKLKKVTVASQTFVTLSESLWSHKLTNQLQIKSGISIGEVATERAPAVNFSIGVHR